MSHSMARQADEHHDLQITSVTRMRTGVGADPGHVRTLALDRSCMHGPELGTAAGFPHGQARTAATPSACLGLCARVSTESNWLQACLPAVVLSRGGGEMDAARRSWWGHPPAAIVHQQMHAVHAYAFPCMYEHWCAWRLWPLATLVWWMCGSGARPCCAGAGASVTTSDEFTIRP